MRRKETTMKIILVEDDSFQSQDTALGLKRDLSATVEVLSTESEFMSQLERIVGDPPDIFIVDMNLRWTDPLPKIPVPPPRVQEEGRFLAGLRCCEALAEHEETRNIPCILYSIVDRTHYEHKLRDLPEWVVYLSKDNLALLFETIQRLVKTGRASRRKNDD